MDVSEFLGLFLIDSELIGLPCWGSTAGPGTGSIFTLQLGRRFPIERTVGASGKVYEYEASSHGVMIWCPWTLKMNSGLICDSESDNANDGVMVKGLNQLVGETIVRVDVDPQTFDLIFTFSNSLVLQCRCEANDEDYTQYTIFFERFSATVEGNMSIRRQEANTDQPT